MIDTSPAIQKSGKKIIYIRRGKGIMTVSDGKTSAGKWHIIDICFGAYNMAIEDLQAQGYTVKTF